MTSAEKTRRFTEAVHQHFGADTKFVTRKQIGMLKEWNVKVPSFILMPQNKLERGRFKVPPLTGQVDINTPDLVNMKVDIKVSEPPAKIIFPKVFCTVPTEGLVPLKDPTFVPFGAYEDVKTIIESGVFLPIYLAGPTRSGKTLIPLQVCAEIKKNLYRANITVETDESDLLGGYKLIGGDTVWEDGPAVKAAEDPDGGLLLLDEIDLGSNKLLCLQPLMEGNGVYIKKINRWVHPTQGFNIIATANTKGRGSDDGKYIGANVMNEAMLERFPITYEQGYADIKTETNILKKNLKLFGVDSPDFVEKLCKWAQTIRKTKENGGVDETISTGRLVYIIKTYVIFGRNRLKAIKDNIARFDLNTQTSFLDAYTKIDDKAVNGPDNLVQTATAQPVAPKKTTW